MTLGHRDGAWYSSHMTNNTNRPTASDIARLAASMRTTSFDPTKGRTAPRTTKTKHNHR